MTNKNRFCRTLVGIAICSALALSNSAFAKGYTLQGNCAKLPETRATEFHGNPASAELYLGMAGNQWVVFDEVIRQFNEYRAYELNEPKVETGIPGHEANYTLEQLRMAGRGDYYIQLIPPGQIRDQIKSGCMLLGNDEVAEPERNFLPLSIQVDFDVFASTNYNLMRDLAANGFLTEALPYTKNQLDLMVAEANPLNIGAGATDYERIFNMVMNLLTDCDDADGNGVCDVDEAITGADPGVRVSQVDHINEGIHRGINSMYRAMDKYIRDNGSPGDVAALDMALEAVATSKPGSPAETRTANEGIKTNFDLKTNPECVYWTDEDNNGEVDPEEPVQSLRFCEYAVLNKTNTHETRVHHVETPSRIRAGTSDVGPLWVTEVKYAQNAQDEDPTLAKVEGVGVPDAVNEPVVYSIALLATSKNPEMARKFIDWIRGPGQNAYTQGGFLEMSDADLGAGVCYSLKKGELMDTPREGGC